MFEDATLLSRVSQQQDELGKNFAMLVAVLGRLERHNETEQARSQELADSFHTVEDTLKKALDYLHKLVRLGQDQKEMLQNAIELLSERTERIEAKAMMRRSASRRADDIEDEDTQEDEKPRPSKRRRYIDD